MTTTHAQSRDAYDLGIIGGGSGGLTAARFAADLGARVALIERDRLGGDCTWAGCVPSKALLRGAGLAQAVTLAQDTDLVAAGPELRFEAVRRRIRRSMEQVAADETPDVLERRGIGVFMGAARFRSPHHVDVDGRSVQARHWLIATGAAPVVPPIRGLDTVAHDTYLEVFERETLPRSLIILGAGPIGLELAQAHRRLGAEVTVVAEQILPHDDAEAAAVVREALEREGVRIVLGLVTEIAAADEGIVATIVGARVSGARLLVATGRAPNLAALDLDRAGVAHDRRGIPVDARLRTSVRHIYAAGDVIRGGLQFTHVAAAQGFQAARNALLPGAWTDTARPTAWVTFTDPELAQVGLTESAAVARYGPRTRVIGWPLDRVDRARCDDRPHGFVKILATPRGRIVGATVVAPHAGDLSGELSLAVAARLDVRTVAGALHAYPTYATAIQQACSAHVQERWLHGRQAALLRRLKGYTGTRLGAPERIGTP